MYECMSEIVLYTLPSQEQNKTVNSDLSSSDRQRKMGVSGRVYQPSLVSEIVYTHCPLRSRTKPRILICPEMMGN